MSTTKKRVAVTGINGKVGQHVVDQLLEHGHEVFGIDQTPAKRTDIISIVADLTDYGQTFDALGSVGWDVLGDTVDNAFDVVVHLAAVPHPASTATPRRSRTTSLRATTCSRLPTATA